GLVSACSSNDVDLVNMSIEGYLNPSDPFDAQVYGLVADAVSYCRSRGIAVFGAAGNEHLRVDRVNTTVGGRSFEGVGPVAFGALEDKGLICTNPITSALFNSACFKLAGQGFGWLQGTSMSSPNAVGVAALTLSARQNLIGRPDALLARLQSTANQSPVNYMGPNDPANFAASLAGTPCPTGYCHIDQADAVPFADAYGAGLVDAAAAVAH